MANPSPEPYVEPQTRVQPASKPKVRQKFGLRTFLVLPFALEVLVFAIVIGALSWRSGQQTVNDLAGELREEVADRVVEQLGAYVDVAHDINQLNGTALIRNDIDVQAGEGAYYFWQKARRFPGTTLIYCGDDATGAFFGAGRFGSGNAQSLDSFISNESTGYTWHYYSLTASGDRGSYLRQDSDPYDPRIRPWYEQAKAEGSAAWTQIYLDFATGLPTITASLPVYAPGSSELLGVCATDVFLPAQFTEFLRGLDIGRTGQAFVVERSGDRAGVLVASSTEEELAREVGGNVEYLRATESSNAIVRATAGELLSRFGDLATVDASQAFDFPSDSGDRYFVQATPFSDPEAAGIDWLVVTIVPEEDFIGQINASRLTTLLLSVVALGGAIALGAWTSGWMARSIRSLNTASEALAAGDFSRRAGDYSVRELDALARSFNQMSAQLQSTFAALEENKAELEARVADRTEQLAQQERQARSENESLQEDVGQLLDIVGALESGDLSVRAQVSDRLTGLVADILNRLIEELRRIATQVLATAREVAREADRLEQLTQTAAEDTRQQASAVQQVLALSEQMEQASQATAAEVEQATAALETEQNAIERGQAAIAEMTGAIAQLQAGKERLVERLETLDEFVELADRFVQDQSDIASLTQILAMNAAAIAARASKQQDPRQFAVVASEFEAIATQIGDLAEQTNDSTGTLRQRTGQIQTSVAEVEADVKQLENLVNRFTVSVEQSQATIAEVEAIGSEVALSEARVADANREILSSAEATARETRAIANLADRAAQVTQTVRERAQEVDRLAESLLVSMEFFKLPAQPSQALPPSEDPSSEPASTVLPEETDEDGNQGYKLPPPAPPPFFSQDYSGETDSDLPRSHL